ncbi:hypothetical protein ACVFVO_12645 [Advenella kashmirensis]
MAFEKWAVRKGDALGVVYEAYRVGKQLSLVKYYMNSHRDGFVLVKESAYEKLGPERLDALFDECWNSPNDFYQIDEDGVTKVGRRAPYFG